MAMAETAARKLLHGGAIARGVADVGGLSFGLWDLVTGFFANILAALAGVAHLLVLPLEMLWQCLVAIITGAAAAIGAGLEGLWQHITGFFTGIFSALASLPHLLVLPLEKLWQWLATAAADAAGAIGAGLDGLWQHVTGFFTGIFSALASLPHLLVLPLEKLWQWLSTAAADAAAAISSGADGLWKLATGLFPRILAALAVAAHEVPQKLEELWRWVKAAAAVALPFVLGVAAVLLVVALVWYCAPALSAAAVGACQALVYAFSYLGLGLYHVAVAAGGVVSWLLPPCAQCLRFCADVTMKAPGTGGMVISRAAFEAAPELFFQILHAAGAVVATAVFCLKPVALLVAAPVAALFRVSVGA